MKNRIHPQRSIRRPFITLLLLLLLGGTAQAAFDVNSFDEQPQGYHLGSLNFWNTPYFANFLAIDTKGWIDPNGWSTLWRDNPSQMNENGYPLYLKEGQILQSMGFSDIRGLRDVPSTWPDRSQGFNTGQITLVWEGTADIRCNVGRFLPSKSTPSAPKGSSNGGTRVYLIDNEIPRVVIHSIDSNHPPTRVKCWLPDPADPQNRSLVDHLYHPALLDLIQAKDWAWIRFMLFGEGNASPEKDWSDRRRPDYYTQNGVLNRRDPGEGAYVYTDSNGVDIYFTDKEGNRKTGCAYELMIALCNETDKNPWISIPHLATDDYLTKLAQLFKYGSDGIHPYESPQDDPVWAPLKSTLKVFVENSNEIWSSGYAFPQGHWAMARAKELGISKPQFNARQSAHFWDIFEAVMGEEAVVRTAGIWNGVENYTRPYLKELTDLSREPEIIATTTYFGNAIQHWVNENEAIELPPGKTPWDSAYWAGPEMTNDMRATLAEWTRLVLSGTKHGGNTGYDEVGKPGGFNLYLNDICVSNNIPLVAYEGGPDIYTDKFYDDALTLFMSAINRHPDIYPIYYTHMNQSFERGLRANTGFYDVGVWGRYGQWGHKECLGQPLEEAPKFQLLLDAFDEFKTLRSIHNPQGRVPQFDTAPDLPRAETGIAYHQTLVTRGGDGERTVQLINSLIPKGLVFDLDTLTMSGTPTEGGTAYLYLRVVDADNDPAWRTFSFPVVQRSSDPAITLDFETQTGEENGSIPEQPLQIGDYAFSCPTSTNGLAIRSQTIGWPNEWPSIVLHGVSWNADIAIDRMDKKTFDLFSVEVGSRHADRCVITADHLGGGTSERTIDIPKTTPVLTLVELDLVSVTRVTVAFYDSADNKHKFGAIDNLKFNQAPIP